MPITAAEQADFRPLHSQQASTMEILQLADDALCAWVEQETATKAGDPVELSDEEVRRLIHFLQIYLDTRA